MAGKFDQYRRDLEFDAVYQAFRAMGRLLLAEPEDEPAEMISPYTSGNPYETVELLNTLAAPAGVVEQALDRRLDNPRAE